MQFFYVIFRSHVIQLATEHSLLYLIKRKIFNISNNNDLRQILHVYPLSFIVNILWMLDGAFSKYQPYPSLKVKIVYYVKINKIYIINEALCWILNNIHIQFGIHILATFIFSDLNLYIFSNIHIVTYPCFSSVFSCLILLSNGKIRIDGLRKKYQI